MGLAAWHSEENQKGTGHLRASLLGEEQRVQGILGYSLWPDALCNIPARAVTDLHKSNDDDDDKNPTALYNI